MEGFQGWVISEGAHRVKGKAIALASSASFHH